MHIKNSHIAKLMALVLSVVVLFSMSGISIYSHICSHNNTKTYSVFVSAKKCTHHAHENKQTNCCKTINNNAYSKCNTQAEENKCCSDQKEFKKLDTKALISHNTSKVKFVNYIILSSLFCKVYGFSDLNIQNTLKYYLIESPPPLTCLEYLSCIQVFLI